LVCRAEPSFLPSPSAPLGALAPPHFDGTRGPMWVGLCLAPLPAGLRSLSFAGRGRGTSPRPSPRRVFPRTPTSPQRPLSASVRADGPGPVPCSRPHRPSSSFRTRKVNIAPHDTPQQSASRQEQTGAEETPKETQEGRESRHQQGPSCDVHHPPGGPPIAPVLTGQYPDVGHGAFPRSYYTTTYAS